MGVAVGTTALIVILSVFNGIDLVLKESTSSFTPDIVISPLKGKFIDYDTALVEEVRKDESILHANPVVEENALLKYGERLKPVTLKGVESDYGDNSGIGNNILQGEFELKNGDSYKSVIGYGVAAELNIGLNFLTPMIFYYPDKESGGSSSGLNSAILFPSGFFSSQQDIDDKYVITDIHFAQQLFNIDHKLSKIELQLKNPDETEQVKTRLKESVGDRYKVEDKYELNRTFYAMMKSEKLAVFLILLFILLIASFNIVGSISMLILDKKEDLKVYKALGMPVKNIVSVFKTEGNLITALGTFVGVVIGITVCLLQENFGFIKVGDGNFLIESYPVKLIFSDICIIIITVIFIGYIASYFPVKYLVRKLIR